MSARPRPQLSVVISTLGNYATLERVLDGYSRQRALRGSFEVVVVVDAADPDPDAADRAIGERTFPVRRSAATVPGLSANRNVGWRLAEAPIVLFTDNDTIPVPRLVLEHLSWHRQYEDEAVGVQGCVRWARELRITPFMRWLDTGIQFDFQSIEGIEAGWGRFAGANASVKRSFLERVGDFDQQNFPYGYEDTDWAYRASKLGFRLLYNSRAMVDHVRPMSVEFWQRRARRIAAAEYRFSKLHPDMPPWFHRMFSEAMERPPARGRGIGLARWVPRGLAGLGPKVWASVDLAYKQAIAPHFMAAWEEAAANEGRPPQPDLSEFASGTPLGDASSGPK